LEGKAVAANILAENHATVDYAGIPTAVFSIPPLARVGLLEEEARQQNLAFSVKHEEVPHWYTARRVNEPCYAFKTLVEEDTDRVLGAHIVGPEAAEVINLFGFAIRSGLTAADLKYATFAYPTAASDLESMLP
jgi:glutathione reductase (NADPH)